MIFVWVNESNKTITEEIEFKLAGLQIDGCPADQMHYTLICKPNERKSVNLVMTGEPRISMGMQASI